jgi:hypothetical protein
VGALAVGPSGRRWPGQRLLLLLVLWWGPARPVPEEQGQAGDDGADRDPEPKEIALSVPGHDLAQEHHREDRDDQTDELALQSPTS